jgi:hypothetical protein
MVSGLSGSESAGVFRLETEFDLLADFLADLLVLEKNQERVFPSAQSLGPAFDQEKVKLVLPSSSFSSGRQRRSWRLIFPKQVVLAV